MAGRIRRYVQMSFDPEALTYHMKNRKLSQRRLAITAGVGRRSVERILTRNQEPTLDMINKLAKAVGISPAALLTWGVDHDEEERQPQEIGEAKGQ